MFNQVIQPWSAADGGTAALFFNLFTGKLEVALSKPLDLDIAPFRLVAIVNRIDLGRTASGLGGYGGSPLIWLPSIRRTSSRSSLACAPIWSTTWLVRITISRSGALGSNWPRMPHRASERHCRPI